MDVERTIEFILGMRAKAEVEWQRVREERGRMREAQDGTDRQIAATNQTLRRAIRLGVQEARAERQRRKELDVKFEQRMSRSDEEIARLAAEIRTFLESLRRSGNGSH